LKAQVNTVERRFGNTTEQTSSESRTRGLAHFWVLFAHGDSQDTCCGTETCEVPGAHGALNKVITESFNVDQHQCVQRPVQTKWHQEWVQHRDQDGADECCVAVQPNPSDTDGRAEPHTERTNEDDSNLNGEQQRQKWHQYHVHCGWID